MDILTEIIAHKRSEIKTLTRKRVSMKAALASSPSGIIAEFKRRSPSKGWIKADARVEDIIPAYEAEGAAALSILTDKDYFEAQPEDLPAARSLTRLPILRKDFIIDPLQLYEARAMGADAVLLIAACLDKETCRRLTEEAHRIGLEVLLELHDASELDYADLPVEMLGVNNRHLGTFHTDVSHSLALAEELKMRLEGMPADSRPLLVAESGIRSAEDIRRLRECGYRGFLIGEHFMRGGGVHELAR